MSSPQKSKTVIEDESQVTENKVTEDKVTEDKVTEDKVTKDKVNDENVTEDNISVEDSGDESVEDESDEETDSDIEVIDFTNDRFYQVLSHLFEAEDGTNIVTQIANLNKNFETHNQLLKVVAQQLASMQVTNLEDTSKSKPRKKKDIVQ